MAGFRLSVKRCRGLREDKVSEDGRIAWGVPDVAARRSLHPSEHAGGSGPVGLTCTAVFLEDRGFASSWDEQATPAITPAVGAPATPTLLSCRPRVPYRMALLGQVGQACRRRKPYIPAASLFALRARPGPRGRLSAENGRVCKGVCKEPRNPLNALRCGRGGTGRRARFRSWCPRDVWVRVPPPAPEPILRSAASGRLGPW